MKTYLDPLLLAALLLYGLAFTVAGMDYNSAFVDEAFHILLGRELLAGEPCPGCPYATGWTWIHPVAAALGDSVGGLSGARGVSAIFGLGLTTVIYASTSLQYGSRIGVIAAALFLLSAQALYLMKLATYDMIAAFFLGSSILAFVAAERARPAAGTALLVLGSVALFLAAITKFLIPVFVPFVVLWVAYRHGVRRAFLACVLPLATLAVAFHALVFRDILGAVVGHIAESKATSRLPITTIADWAFRWIAMIALLAVFGMFNKGRGATAAAFIALSTPILILHLATQAEQSLNKNVVFSLVFLAPAGALGVDHIGNLFSMRQGERLVKRFFVGAILVIYWAYGITNLRWLERQYPDVTEVIDFFHENGFSGMTVVLNGWDGVIYDYALAGRHPGARFLHVSLAGEEGGAADFVVCEDGFYGQSLPCGEHPDLAGEGRPLLAAIPLELSWGESEARIYGRRPE